MRFLFVDRIEHIEKNKFARGTKVVSFEEGFLASPYATKGFFPPLLLLEAAAQLTSWLIMYSTDFTLIPMLAKIEKVLLYSNIRCGISLTINVNIHSLNTEGAVINASIISGNELVARGINCLCFFTDLEKYFSKSEMRAQFLDLSRNAKIH